MAARVVEYYAEDGQPVLGPDPSDVMQQLWSVTAQQELERREGLQPRQKGPSFSLDEFFKLLCWSRAELDICAATVDLLGGGAPEAASIRLHAVPVPDAAAPATAPSSHFARLLEATGRLARRLRADALKNRREREHEHHTVLHQLLPLRRDQHWVLLRAPKALPVFVDPARFIPLVAIDFAPQRLFPRTTPALMAPHYCKEPVDAACLALVVRERSSGQLHLKIWHKNDRTLVLTLNGHSFGSLPPPDQHPSWHALLEHARNRAISRHIFALLATEASTDIVEGNHPERLVLDRAGRSLIAALQLDPPPAPPSTGPAADLYQRLWLNYLNSDGQTVGWAAGLRDQI